METTAKKNLMLSIDCANDNTNRRNTTLRLPMCAVCGKPVERIAFTERMGRPVVDYKVWCHGEEEVSFIGLWAAFELQSKGTGLPDAFSKYAKKIDCRWMRKI